MAALVGNLQHHGGKDGNKDGEIDEEMDSEKEDGDGKKWKMKVERWSNKWRDGDGKWNGLGEEG